MHPSSQRFHAILKELGELHDLKQKDYGRADDPFANVRATQDWGIPAWQGAMIRATDKVKRLQAYAQNGRLANEGVEDSLRDLAVYAVIALVLYEELQILNKAMGEPDDTYDMAVARYMSGVGAVPNPSYNGSGLPDATGWTSESSAV
jgi:hypothetical protein